MTALFPNAPTSSLSFARFSKTGRSKALCATELKLIGVNLNSFSRQDIYTI